MYFSSLLQNTSTHSLYSFIASHRVPEELLQDPEMYVTAIVVFGAGGAGGAAVQT